MKTGAPRKVSMSLARRIAAKVRKGQTIADAAESCGVDRSSVFNWLKAGDAGDSDYKEFSSMVREAISAGKRPKQAG